MTPWSEALRIRRVVGAPARTTPGTLWVDDARGACTGFGRDARRAWVRELAAGSVAVEQALQFGLLGPEDAFTAGAALNCALLAAAGRRAVLCDEDVDEAQLFAPPSGPRGPRGDPTALEVLSGAAVDAPPLADPIGAHPDAPVQCFGLAGDSGMRSSAPYLARGGAWLAERAERWPDVAASRTVLRAAPAPARGAHLMSALLRVDLRTFLPPPLLPVLRNTDGLWGRHLADLGAPALHLPAAARHRDKPGCGTSRAEAVLDLTRPRTTDLLSLLPVEAWPARPQEWPGRLLGPWRAHLERLAERLDDARRSCPGSAIALKSDLHAALSRLPAAARAVPAPVDLVGGWPALADLAARFGALRAVWPEVWARAVQCRPRPAT